MENKTVKELKQIAKERKIKYYYKLTKGDLVRALQPQRSILSWFLRRPVPAPRPVAHQAHSLRSSRPIPAPRPVSNDLISFGPARLQNRATRDETSIIDEPFQDTSEIITPRPVPATRPGLFSRFKTTVNHGFNRVLEVIDPYVPTPVKNVVINVKKGVVKTIKSLKDIVFTPAAPVAPTRPIPAPRPKRARPVPAPRPIVFKLTNHAVERAFRQFSYEPSVQYQDIAAFFNLVRKSAINVMEGERNTKARIILTCEMKSVSILTGEEDTRMVSLSRSEIILEATNLRELMSEMEEKVLENSVKYNKMGSNCRLSNILRMDINFIDYKPLSGSSYIELPNDLKNKKAIINIQNEDNECFKWCVTRALNMKNNHPERIDKELIEKSKELHWDGMEFPVKIDQIEKFEKNNADISVFVCGLDENQEPYPLKKIKFFGRKHHIDLLIITNETTSHYCLIHNFSRLFSTKTSKGKRKQHYCRNCLQGYDKEEKLQQHQPYCYENAPVRIILPKEGTTIQFKNYKMSMKVPYVVYADFESFLRPVNTCTPNSKQSYTKQYQKHVRNSFCYYIKCFDDSLYKGKPVTYTAESDNDDVAQKFIDSLETDLTKIFKTIDFKKKKVITDEDEKNFKEATQCHICEEELEDDKVWDHCHLTGKYRGAAHKNCNTKYRVPKFIPILFHNLSGYDSHLFIKKLGGKLKCIPNNEEKYISFSKKIKVREFTDEKGKLKEVWREIRFIDSVRFQSETLDKLSKNLNNDQCKNVAQYYSGKQFDLLRKKGVYPYEWVDSIKKFSEAQLPPIEAFYSKLNDEGISSEDYAHSQEVWKVFNCKTFRDYHNIYNVSDVLILADVFENFRNICNENYGLDPPWYFYLPQFSLGCNVKINSYQIRSSIRS